MATDGVRERNNAYLRSLPDVCRCGHGRMEHYDGWAICTWAVTGECDCDEWVASAPVHGGSAASQKARS